MSWNCNRQRYQLKRILTFQEASQGSFIFTSGSKKNQPSCLRIHKANIGFYLHVPRPKWGVTKLWPWGTCSCCVTWWLEEKCYFINSEASHKHLDLTRVQILWMNRNLYHNKTVKRLEKGLMYGSCAYIRWCQTRTCWCSWSWLVALPDHLPRAPAQKQMTGVMRKGPWMGMIPMTAWSGFCFVTSTPRNTQKSERVL